MKSTMRPCLPVLLAIAGLGVVLPAPARAADTDFVSYNYISRGSVTYNGSSLGAFTIANLYFAFDSQVNQISATDSMVGPYSLLSPSLVGTQTLTDSSGATLSPIVYSLVVPNPTTATASIQTLTLDHIGNISVTSNGSITRYQYVLYGTSSAGEAVKVTIAGVLTAATSTAPGTLTESVAIQYPEGVIVARNTGNVLQSVQPIGSGFTLTYTWEFSESGSVTMPSVLTDSDTPGSVIITNTATPGTGNGTFVFVKDQLYTGGTTITSGATLQLGNGGTSGSVLGDIVDNGHLIFDRSDSTSFLGAITGTGTVEVTGGGTLMLAAPNAGLVSVDDARVILTPGSSGTSAFSIDAGGTLSGTATIGALTVNSGGTVSPGYSPGTLSVTGDLTFNPGSTYVVDLAAAGVSDLITATGTATINGGTVKLNLLPGFEPDHLYTIVTSTGARTGAFDGVASDYLFVTPELSYDANTVYLNVTHNGTTFTSVAQTPNQWATGAALDTLPSGALNSLLLLTSADDARQAFDSLSGEAYASLGSVFQQESIYVRQAATARLRQAAAGADALGQAAQASGPVKAQVSKDLGVTLWATGYGGWGNTFGNGNAATISNNLGGFLIGADVDLQKNVWAGLFAGYSRTSFDVSARASSGNSDNYDIGAYAGAQLGAWALRGGLAYTWHDVQMNRSVAFTSLNERLNAGYGQGTAQVFGEVGYDLNFGAMAVEPFAALAYVNVGGASFAETGGTAALAVSTQAMGTTYTTLGARMATTTDAFGARLTPSLTLGWQHAFGDTLPVSTMQFLAGTTPFGISGAPIATDMVLVDAGLSYALSRTTNLAVAYTGQYGENAAQSAFTAQLALRF